MPKMLHANSEYQWMWPHDLTRQDCRPPMWASVLLPVRCFIQWTGWNQFSSGKSCSWELLPLQLGEFAWITWRNLKAAPGDIGSELEGDGQSLPEIHLESQKRGNHPKRTEFDYCPDFYRSDYISWAKLRAADIVDQNFRKAFLRWHVTCYFPLFDFTEWLIPAVKNKKRKQIFTRLVFYSIF